MEAESSTILDATVHLVRFSTSRFGKLYENQIELILYFERLCQNLL